MWDCGWVRYVIFWSSCPHQWLKCPVFHCFKWTQVFSNPTHKFCPARIYYWSVGMMACISTHVLLNGMPSNVLGREWLALTKCWDLGWALRAMVEVEEQDALGLRQLSLKLISTHIITKYGKLHYSTLIRVVESCTMVLIQHGWVERSTERLWITVRQKW